MYNTKTEGDFRMNNRNQMSKNQPWEKNLTYIVIGLATLLACVVIVFAILLFPDGSKRDINQTPPVECTNTNKLLIDSNGKSIVLFSDSTNNNCCIIYGNENHVKMNCSAINGDFSINTANNSDKSDTDTHQIDNPADTESNQNSNKNNNNNSSVQPNKDNLSKENEKNNTPALSKEEIIATEIVAKVEGKSDYEKVKYFHDYICENTVYDSKNVDKGIITEEASSAYGSLVKGLAVCSGYSKALQLLCDSAGIECYYVVGETHPGFHAWNVVKIDGIYYQIDVTWDDEDNFYNYEYFLVSDAFMENTRSWERSQAPACNSDKYLLAKHSVAENLNEMEEIIIQAYEQGDSDIEFLTTFPVDLGSEQTEFLFDYDVNGDGTYSYYAPKDIGNYYKIRVIL